MAELQVLLETKNELTSHLNDILTDQILQELEVLYDALKTNTSTSGILKKYQEILSNIPDWSKEQKHQVYQRVIGNTGVEYFTQLLHAIMGNQVKVILKTEFPNQEIPKLKFKIPSAENFIHMCLVSIARVLWKQTYLIYHNVRTIERQHNIAQIEEYIKKSIASTIRFCLPLEHLFKYIQEHTDINIEEEDDDVEEEDDEVEEEDDEVEDDEVEEEDDEVEDEDDEVEVEEDEVEVEEDEVEVEDDEVKVEEDEVEVEEDEVEVEEDEVEVEEDKTKCEDIVEEDKTKCEDIVEEDKTKCEDIVEEDESEEVVEEVHEQTTGYERDDSSNELNEREINDNSNECDNVYPVSPSLKELELEIESIMDGKNKEKSRNLPLRIIPLNIRTEITRQSKYKEKLTTIPTKKDAFF
jgi:hypothetical protein